VSPVAWAPALAPVRHVPVVDVGNGSVEEFKKGRRTFREIVLVHSVVLKPGTDLFAEYTNAPPVIFFNAASEGQGKSSGFIATREHDILTGTQILSLAKSTAYASGCFGTRRDGERIGRST